ncbi:CMRF35-like molecule 1 isoform X2 [Notolabrus celidotus]|uniref:CMRF35-like molecule 1 isoform X2 n=1 Tax=Notolabrus celidotus TaxID=1203425 RepID=UPI0014903E6F|nr:CMRF35-like molecule 1 isoform X2 [Notolabrus celidotus]
MTSPFLPYLLLSGLIDTRDNTGKFSISDDPKQEIFTVTINDCTYKTGETWYWCAVEINRGLDVKQHFKLSVTEDLPSVHVDQQEITAFEGGSVTVLCHYKYQKKMGWCKLGSTCVTKQTRSIHGTTVTINKTVPYVFNVTMSGLSTENSGWYWCDNGDFQMPVHLTVNIVTSSTAETADTTTKGLHFTNIQANGESLQDENKGFTEMIILITTFILLLLLVAAAFLGWRMLKRKSKPQAPNMTVDSQTESDPEVLYAKIQHKKGLAGQRKNQRTEDTVTYSAFVMKDHVQQATEPADGDVIYSTVQKQK